MAKVILQDGESIENALRRFKRQVLNEDIIKETKRRSYYLKPGQKKRLKSVLAPRKRDRKVRSVSGLPKFDSPHRTSYASSFSQNFSRGRRFDALSSCGRSDLSGLLLDHALYRPTGSWAFQVDEKPISHLLTAVRGATPGTGTAGIRPGEFSPRGKTSRRELCAH